MRAFRRKRSGSFLILPKELPMSRFMSVSEVAREYEVTSTTVLRWIRTGKFVPVRRTPTGRILFERSDVLKYFGDVA